MIAAVLTVNKQAYLNYARLAGDIVKNHEALKPVEHNGDDIPESGVTSLPRTVQHEPDRRQV